MALAVRLCACASLVCMAATSPEIQDLCDHMRTRKLRAPARECLYSLQCKVFYGRALPKPQLASQGGNADRDCLVLTWPASLPPASLLTDTGRSA